MEYARPLRDSCRFRDGLSVLLETNMRDAEHFKQMYRAGEAPWDLGKPDANLIHAVTTTLIRPCRTLEIGCGTGDNAIWLAQQGFDVVAVDVSSIAIEQATAKAAKIGTKCDFLVLDIFRKNIEGGPFGFVFDRGFLHTIESDQVRKSFAETVSEYLDAGGLWLSLLGNADEVRRGSQGPPQRSARDIVNAVEPHFEILSLISVHFESRHVDPARAWVCMMRKR
jgi:SAM-dependent methyltransferase